MQIVYLGLFAKVFNWVFNKILSPVINFIGNILSKVLGWVFTKILIPVLNFVINSFIEVWKVEIKLLFSTFLLKVNLFLLAVVDAFENAMDYFIGITKVTYYAGGIESGSTGVPMTMLEAFISLPIIRYVFLLVTALGLGLALVFTIIGVMKSTLDFDFENKRPVSAVLSSFMKTCIQFLIVPFLSLFIIKLAQEILIAIQRAFFLKQNGEVLLSSSVSMASSVCSLIVQKGSTSLSKEILSGEVAWYNITTLVKGGNFLNYDYLSGIVVSLFLIGIMGTVVVLFVKRIFEVLLLYVVSPLFVATIPLDDGEKFGKWKELFIGKIFTGYGSIIAMRLYLAIAPVIMSDSNITFPNSAVFGNSQELSYVIRLIFLVGGAFAMLKSGTMITQLISFRASSDEAQTSHAVQGAMGGVGMQVLGRAKQRAAGTFKATKALASMASKQMMNEAINALERQGNKPQKWTPAKPNKSHPELRKNLIGTQRAGASKPTIGANRGAALKAKGLGATKTRPRSNAIAGGTAPFAGKSVTAGSSMSSTASSVGRQRSHTIATSTPSASLSGGSATTVTARRSTVSGSVVPRPTASRISTTSQTSSSASYSGGQAHVSSASVRSYSTRPVYSSANQRIMDAKYAKHDATMTRVSQMSEEQKQRALTQFQKNMADKQRK